MDVARRVVFMGSKAGGRALATLLCDEPVLPTPSLMLCPDDRLDARSDLAGFEALAARTGIPLQLQRGTEEVVAALSLQAPATVLVHGWYRLIPIDRLPGLRFFGFHYSALPAYRGNAPLVWQIIQGESRIGVSFFEFGAGIDDGHIVAQRSFEFGADDTIADALREAERACLAITRESLDALLAGRLVPSPQPALGASYCGLRSPEDGRIDWGQPARRVHDFVRAQTRPYPGAYTELPDGNRLRIWRTRVDARLCYGVPGSVLAIEGDSVLVACGADSAVQVLGCGAQGLDDAPPSALLGSLRMRLGRQAA